MKYSKLDGMKIVSLDAKDVGEINGAEVDTKNWSITHIHIELSDSALKELNIKKPLIGNVTLCFPVGFIKKVGDVITLSRNLDGLKKIPECR
jgi:sporulation protein YlmC with PRC-barrel domain